MRSLRFLTVAVLLTLSAVPEFVRYAGERSLYRLNALAQSLSAQPLDDAQRRSILAEISRDAERLKTSPGDCRALQLAGVSALMANNPQRAVGMFRIASRCGERPEVDADLALAYAALGRTADADSALLRAAWISPALVTRFEPQTEAQLTARMHLLDADLRAGRLRASDLPPSPATAAQ